MQAMKLRALIEKLETENPSVANEPNITLAKSLLDLAQDKTPDLTKISDKKEKQRIKEKMLQNEQNLDTFIQEMNALKEELIQEGEYDRAGTIAAAIGLRLQKEADPKDDPYAKVNEFPSRRYFDEGSALFEQAQRKREQEVDLNKVFHLICKGCAENNVELPETNEDESV